MSLIYDKGYDMHIYNFYERTYWLYDIKKERNERIEIFKIKKSEKYFISRVESREFIFEF